MIRLTGLVSGVRLTLVEFHDPVGVVRARNALNIEARRASLRADRAALQEQRRQDRAAFHAERSDPSRSQRPKDGEPEPAEPPPPEPDLTDAELIEQTAGRGQELAGMTQPIEPAKLIATTALAYEQNGWATDVRIEVHE